MKKGYARVSTVEQSLNIQLAALKAAGCQRIYEEKASGVNRERQQLALLLKDLKPGDEVIVIRLDRIARSLAHLLEIMDAIIEAKATFHSLNEPAFDISAATGRLMLSLLGAVAEFERTLIRERITAGVRASIARGSKNWGVGRYRAPEANEKEKRTKDIQHRTKMTEGFPLWAPIVAATRPWQPWYDVRRLIVIMTGADLVLSYLQMFAREAVQLGAIDSRILKATSTRCLEDRVDQLVSAISFLEPTHTAAGVIAILKKMGTPSPNGGSEWTELQILRAISQHRENNKHAPIKYDVTKAKWEPAEEPPAANDDEAFEAAWANSGELSKATTRRTGFRNLI